MFRSSIVMVPVNKKTTRARTAVSSRKNITTMTVNPMASQTKAASPY